MLPASARLRQRAEFTQTVRDGRRARSPRLLAHLLAPAAATQPTVARVGFVVSRAVGPAVVRNRVRRRLRHLMRDRLTALPSGTHVVVRALPSSASASSAQLAADLDRIIGVSGASRVGARRQA